MDERTYISCIILVAVFLGSISILAHLTVLSSAPFPDSNPAFEISENSTHFFYAYNTEVGDENFAVYGPYDLEGKSYTVVRSLGAGKERVYNKGVRIGVLDRIRGIDDRVKGVRDLYIETRIEPFLYSSYAGDLEPDRFNDYGERLVTSSPSENTNQSEREIIYEEGVQGNNLLAHRFLQNLTAVRDRTKKFLDNPSYSNGRDMIKSYENAQQGYEDDLRDLVDIMDNLAERKSSGQLESWVTQSGKTVSPQTIFGDLETIKENAEAIEEETERRQGVLENSREITSGVDETLEEPEKNERLESFYTSEDLIDVYRGRLNVPPKLVTEDEIHGPYDLTINCLEENHLVSRAENPRTYPAHMITDGVARRINYAGRQYYPEGFTNVRTEGEGTKFSPEGFNSTGTLPHSDLVFTYCPCPYYDRTSMNWELVDTVYRELNQSTILLEVNETEVAEELEGYGRKEDFMMLLKEGKGAERLFLDYPSQRNTELLGRYYRQIYIHSYQLTSQGYKSPAIEEKGPQLYRVSSLINGKIGAVQRTLEEYYGTDNGARGYMYTEARRFDNINESNFVKVFDEMDVLRHSAARVTFLPDSDAVWRTEEELDYYSSEEKLPLWTVYTPE